MTTKRMILKAIATDVAIQEVEVGECEESVLLCENCG